MSYKAISDHILDHLSTKTKIDMEYRDIYTYALEKYISGIVNTIIFTAAALLLRIPIEVAVFFIFYTPLRRYAGGIHAKTRSRCLILSLILIILFVKAAEYLSNISFWYAIAGSGILVAILSVFFFAPVDTEKRRLSFETRRQYRRYARSLVMLEGALLFLGICILPFMKRYLLVAVMALLLAGILILPYKKIMEGKKYEEKKRDE